MSDKNVRHKIRFTLQEKIYALDRTGSNDVTPVVTLLTRFEHSAADVYPERLKYNSRDLPPSTSSPSSEMIIPRMITVSVCKPALDSFHKTLITGSEI